MIHIIIRVYGTLTEHFKESSFEVLTPANTVKELINFIAERYGSSFKDAVIDSRTGDAKEAYKILLNGRDIYFLDKLETKIKDGDAVIFFPPVGGGSLL